MRKARNDEMNLCFCFWGLGDGRDSHFVRAPQRRNKQPHVRAEVCVCVGVPRLPPGAGILSEFSLHSWQRLQISVHSDRRSNCFATACLHAAGPDPSPPQPRSLVTVNNVGLKDFPPTVPAINSPPSNY